MENNSTVVLNKEMIQAIANKSETAKEVLKDWSERSRIRHEVDINRLQVKLLHKGIKVIPEQLMQTFKDLESIGVGSIVYGRNGKNDRFVLHYSLKQLGDSVMKPTEVQEFKKLDQQATEEKKEGEDSMAKTTKKRPGRPKGSKNKRRKAAASPNVSTRTVTRTVTRETVLIPFTRDDGDVVTLRFSSLVEANKLADMIKQLSA